jgi:glycosyltransferase involved in cell wall biosynthesis
MKILHIAPTPFFADRGCHIRIHGEITALQRLGHEVTLVTYHLGRDVPGIETRRSLKVPWYKKLDAGFSWHKFYLDGLLFLTAMRAAIKTRPDVIHAHLHEGAAIGWLVSLCVSMRRIPVVFDVQGSLTGELEAYESLGRMRSLLFLFAWGEKLVCRLPDYFVCSSEANARFLQETCKVPGSRIQVLREAVLEDFCTSETGDELRKQLGIDANAEVVIFTGALLAAKGIGYLLEAVPQVLAERPGARFILVGYPVENCQREVDRAGLGHAVRLAGRVDYFRLFPYLAMADVAVDPKMEAAGEGSGKITNYMIAGLPVVCFDTLANRAILGEYGVYASPGSATDLARKIVELLSDVDRVRRLGEHNRQRVMEKYSWRSGGELLDRVYAELLPAVS